MGALDAMKSLIREIAVEIVEQITPELRAAVARPVVVGPSELEPLLLNWEQVSQRLGGMSETKVRELWKREVLPSVKIDGLRFTHRDDLAAYVDSLRGAPIGHRSGVLAVVRGAA